MRILLIVLITISLKAEIKNIEGLFYGGVIEGLEGVTNQIKKITEKKDIKKQVITTRKERLKRCERNYLELYRRTNKNYFKLKEKKEKEIQKLKKENFKLKKLLEINGIDYIHANIDIKKRKKGSKMILEIHNK